MSDRTFLDTNIFVYDVDIGAPQSKRLIAETLIADSLSSRFGVISYQVIQEFLAVATQKFSATVSLPHSRRYLETVLKPMLRVHSSMELFQEALDIQSRWQLSWYDSLIVAAASIRSELFGHLHRRPAERRENQRHPNRESVPGPTRQLVR
jgi:predicted nucleic acid-binding protein